MFSYFQSFSETSTPPRKKRGVYHASVAGIQSLDSSFRLKSPLDSSESDDRNDNAGVGVSSPIINKWKYKWHSSRNKTTSWDRKNRWWVRRLSYISHLVRDRLAFRLSRLTRRVDRPNRFLPSQILGLKNSPREKCAITEGLIT